MAPQSVDPMSKLAYVLPTMQLGVIPAEPSAEATEPEADIASLSLSDDPSPSSSNSAALSAGIDASVLHTDSEIDAEEEAEFETLPETPFGHIFVVGDSADAFGAIKAGHTAYWQAEVAARNILRLVSREESEPDEQEKELELESYMPGLPAIKVSLGIVSVFLHYVFRHL